ncbi:MAG: hypothetical protein OQK98_12735 [Gammaproteobacteria bacterium]|nr:hypothetical protein [Gammaproteobacteria bacterium]
MATSNTSQRNIGIWIFSLLAAAFGLLTIKSGGEVLFIDGEARLAAGHYVPFVLWFNFSAGFVYIIAAIGLWKMRPWSAQLSFLLAMSTLIVFAAFGLHIVNGGEYEMRTVIAMSLRSVVWIVIAVFAKWYFLRFNKTAIFIHEAD